jgi:hypothetical protein
VAGVGEDVLDLGLRGRPDHLDVPFVLSLHRG